MTTYRHVIFLITIVAFLAAFLAFIPGCLRDKEDSRSVVIIRGRDEDKDRLHYDYRAVESEGRDKATGLWKEIVHRKSGVVLRLVPAGEFDMGSPSGEKERSSNEGPVHRVKISEPFYIGKYEVTQKQWMAVMENNPSIWKGDNLPVEMVSWNDAKEFCQKAGGGLRLPSEAEWEYACRAGSKTKWYFGDSENTLGEYAWYKDNSGEKTHEVGKKKPNAWGLYDMHGNVWEWCEDVWYDNYKGAPGDGSAWTRGWPIWMRVCRGGSWIVDAVDTRSANRKWGGPDLANYRIAGFRVAVPVEETQRCLRVLLVEGTPRWEYRFIKNVLLRKKQEFVVWCLLLSADEGSPQEHTPGNYTDERGNSAEIESLKSFPSAKELNKFDVIIWGDINPRTTAYGITPESLEQVASWVMAGDARARGDEIETAVSGGGLIAILGGQYFPRVYKDVVRSSPDRRTMSDILPFTIVPPSVPLDELYGDREKPFKYKIRPEAMRSEILRFYDDPERNRKFWEEGDGEGQSQGLPGSFGFWPIEKPSPTARILVEHSEKKGKDGKPYPLILEHSPGKGRVFTMAIDDTWRWRYEAGDKFFAIFWTRLVKTVAEGSVTRR